MDYATWVKELSYDDLNNLYNNDNTTEIKKDIGDLYSKTFNKDAEKLEIKSNPKMLIVGSEIDDSTFRTINYLNEFLININAVNFNYFKDSTGKEFLAQSFIMPKGNIMQESSNQKNKKSKINNKRIILLIQVKNW